MRRFITALLICCALASGACAPERAAEPAPALWRITDADSEIFLFGTVHMLPDRLHWRTPAVDAALAAADEFITETDTGPAAQAQLPALIQRYAAAPAGGSLRAAIGESEYARLTRAARALEIDPASLDGYRPWFVALRLSFLDAVRQGHNPDAGVENVLAIDARRMGKRELFLETAEEQIRILAELSPADELRFLRVTIDEIERGDDGQMNAMIAAWVRGDVATLGALADAQWRAAGPGVHEAMIVRRNQAWADVIAARLEGAGSSFIAVGAAHLAGESNVVALLRARGIAVEGP